MARRLACGVSYLVESHANVLDENDVAVMKCEQAAGTNVNVSYLRLANRAFLVQASADLSTWSTWDVPGNQIIFGETNQLMNISGPLLAASQYFMVLIFEP